MWPFNSKKKPVQTNTTNRRSTASSGYRGPSTPSSNYQAPDIDYGASFTSSSDSSSSSCDSGSSGDSGGGSCGGGD